MSRTADRAAGAVLVAVLLGSAVAAFLSPDSETATAEEKGVRVYETDASKTLVRKEGEESIGESLTGYLEKKYPGFKFSLAEEHEIRLADYGREYTVFFTEESFPDSVMIAGVTANADGTLSFRDGFYARIMQGDYSLAVSHMLGDIGITYDSLSCYIAELGGEDTDASMPASDIVYGRVPLDQTVMIVLPPADDSTEKGEDAIERLVSFARENKTKGTYIVSCGENTWSFSAEGGYTSTPRKK